MADKYSIDCNDFIEDCIMSHYKTFFVIVLKKAVVIDKIVTTYSGYKKRHKCYNPIIDIWLPELRNIILYVFLCI